MSRSSNNTLKFAPLVLILSSLNTKHRIFRYQAQKSLDTKHKNLYTKQRFVTWLIGDLLGK